MTYMSYMEKRPELIEAIQMFVEHGVAPGSFITAVLQNDLRQACGKADSNNQKHLWDVVAYCHNQIPGACWGSPDKVDAWAWARKSEARSVTHESV